MRAWAGIAVAMAAAVATLAPTTAGDDGANRPAAARSTPQAPAAAPREPAVAARPAPDAPEAAPPLPGRQVVPVLPLGAGLTCLGLGIALIGLRMRRA